MDDLYTKLKKRLTGVCAISEHKKATRLLDMNGLGDKTPSQCLSAMIMLVPEGQEPGFLFRKIFLRQLSSEVSTNSPRPDIKSWDKGSRTSKISTGGRQVLRIDGLEDLFHHRDWCAHRTWSRRQQHQCHLQRTPMFLP